LILTRPESPRAASAEEIESYVPTGIDSSRIALASSADEALRLALAQTPPGGLILITGSLYLVGEIQRTLREQAAHSSSED
jgi:folylpolyglutamate synthase/dihydropteroate synthase